MTEADGKIDNCWLLNVTDFLRLVCPWLSDNNSNLSFKIHESQELSTCLSARAAFFFLTLMSTGTLQLSSHVVSLSLSPRKATLPLTCKKYLTFSQFAFYTISSVVMIRGTLSLSYFSASVLFALIGLQSKRQNRPRLFVLHALFGSLAFRRIIDITTATAHACMIGMFLAVWMGHMSYVLCLQGLKHHEPGIRWDWHRAYKMCWNVRWLGTPHEAPSNTGKPRATASATSVDHQLDEKDALSSTRNSVKRRNFLLSRLLSVAAIYLINVLQEYLLKKYYPFRMSDFAPEKNVLLRRLSTVSIREVIVRTYLVINFVWTGWAVCGGYIVSCRSSSLALVWTSPRSGQNSTAALGKCTVSVGSGVDFGIAVLLGRISVTVRWSQRNYSS